MTRKMKAFGLALMALTVFGALSASSASAQQGKFTTEGGVEATLDIEEIGINDPNQLTTPDWAQSIKCPGTTYTGHKAITHAETTHRESTGLPKHPLIPNGSTTATITPHYAQANCRDGHGRTMTVVTNGCDFVFHLGTTESGTMPVTTDVVCPDSTKGIHITIWSTGVAHTSGSLCTIEMTPQTGIKGAHVVNEAANEKTKNDLRVIGTFENIHVERTGVCLFDFKGETTNAGKLFFDVTVKGTNAAGQPLGITYSD